MTRLHTRLRVRIISAGLGGLSLTGCSEAASSCPDLALRETYRIEYADISDACVAQQKNLKTVWQAMSESWLTVTGWIEDGTEYKQQGCGFQFSNERFDPIAQEVFAFKGDALVGDETGFHGIVSLEWSQVDVDEYRQARATATRKPFCTATARASFIRDLTVLGSSNGAIGAATEAALAAGRGD